MGYAKGIVASTVCTLMLLNSAAGVETAPQPAFKVIGLRVVAPPMDKEESFGAFNSFPGTTVSIVMTIPQGGLIGFDDDRSSLKAFTDDRGGDLTKPDEKPRFQRSAFGMSPTISEDGGMMMFEIAADGVPSRGAAAITLSGSLGLRFATKRAAHQHAQVALTDGTKFKAGPLEGTLKDVGPPAWGDAAMSVTLSFSRDIPEVAAVRFLDRAGKVIPSSTGSSSRMSFGRSVTVERSFNLSQKVDVATIEMSVWTDLQEIELPFTVKAGLGL